MPTIRTSAGVAVLPHAPSPVSARLERAAASPVALKLACALLFVQFVKLHEFLTLAIHFDLHLLNLVVIPALIATFMASGFSATLRYRAAKLWLGYALLMTASLPFSSWIGGSATLVLTFLRSELLTLFVAGGLVMVWAEFSTLVSTLFWATGALLALCKIFAVNSSGRVELEGDTSMGNANDLAALVILLLPFVLLVILNPARAALTRILGVVILLYGLYVALSTGSRGALIALLAMSAVAFFKVDASRKIAALLLLPALGGVLMVALPPQTQHRLATAFGAAPAHEDDEAIDSATQRNYLLMKSLEVSLHHPLFGVGPGQFSNYEGLSAAAAGTHGAWHETHNAYTQASSEIGVPAGLVFVCAIFGTIGLAGRVHKQSRRRPPTKVTREITLTALCILLSVAGFAVASFFLSFAYKFYFPVLTGLTISLHRAATRTWEDEDSGLRPSLA